MSLHRGTKQFQFERLVHYFVRPGGDSSIDKRSVGKGGSYDHGYVSRRRIRFEPRCGLISRHRRHVEIHDNQIGTGHACLTYGLKPRRRFNTLCSLIVVERA